MFFKEYAPYLELGGLLLTILEFLGLGAIIHRFVEWQLMQFRCLYSWFDGETELKLLKTKINNVNYFYILFTLITLYITFVQVSINQIEMTTGAWVILVLIYIAVYFFIWKVLLPVLQFLLGLYYWVLSILISRGIMAILGLLIAVTGFVVSSTTSTTAPTSPAIEVNAKPAENSLNAGEGKQPSAKSSKK
jgi:hypothetical protein